MSRFFKSAAFPILIVIVLAIFVSHLYTSGGGGKQITWSDLQNDVAGNQVTYIKSDQAGSSVSFKLAPTPRRRSRSGSPRSRR